MPTAFEDMLERLSHPPLPKSLPIAQVIRVMSEMGYELKVTGSHHHSRKPGARRVTFAVHRNRIGPAAVRELAALMRQGRGT